MFKIAVIVVYLGIMYCCIWRLYELKRCTEMIEATYVREVRFYANRLLNFYNIVFQYQYNGENYESISMDVVSSIKLKNICKIPNQRIYINPQKPRKICMKAEIKMFDLACIIVLVMFLVVFIMIK